MARGKGIRKTINSNVPGMPGSTPFIPTNGAGPGIRDPRSAGQDRPSDYNPPPIYHG